MAQVDFVKSDAVSHCTATLGVKEKYHLLRPGHQLVVNGFTKSAVVFNNKQNTCRSDTAVNGFVPKETTADEIPIPKIRIESEDAVSLEWRKVSAYLCPVA